MDFLIPLVTAITVVITIISILTIIQARNQGNYMLEIELRNILSQLKGQKFTVIIQDDTGNIILERQLDLKNELPS